jgi:hypothetical protein
MKSLTQAARSICYACAHALDMARETGGEKWQNLANLLTPIAKAFPTDIGVEVASLGIQIHGGMGFIEETGAARLLRDARIAPIYEGTNGIQAIDLVSRKLPLAGGETIDDYIGELREIAGDVRDSNRPEFGETAACLKQALDDFASSKDWMLEQMGKGESEIALAGATPFLRLAGLAIGGCYLAKSALQSDGENDFGRTALARFFAENLLNETSGLKARTINGSESLFAAANAALHAG